MGKRYQKKKPRISGKSIAIGLVVAVIVGGVVWSKLPRYRTLYKGTAGLNPFQENYVYEPVKIDSRDALYLVDVEARGGRTLSAYLFSKEGFQYYADAKDGRGGKGEPIAPLWSATEVEAHREEGIKLDYTGDAVFVVSNEKWNQLGVAYRLAVKKP